jgi:hypothetical protein
MPETATWLEITWTAIATVALGFTLWIVDDNIRNFAAIRRAVARGKANHWGARWWVAFASLVTSVAMLVVWIGFEIVGIIGMTVSPRVSPTEREAALQVISGWLMISTALVLAGIQAWQVFARTKIRPLVQPVEQMAQKEN